MIAVGSMVTPAVSLSVTVATTSSTVIPSYPPPLTVWVRVWESWAALSSSFAVTVTFWAVPQLIVVKVRVSLSRVRAVPAPPMVTVTSPGGSVSRETV